MIPTTIAIIAFNLGPPGALIHLTKLGLKNAPIPNNNTINPVIIRIVFAISMVSTLV